jgi:hypothetical protein
LINNFFLGELYFTKIEVEVPIPTDRFGLTVSVTVSPSLKLCAVETETVDLIFCTFAFT